MVHNTSRLKLSALDISHIKALYEICCNNEKAMALALKGRVLSFKEFIEFLNEYFIFENTDSCGFWGVSLKTTNQIIGLSGIIECNYLGHKDFEIGFIFDHNNWGKGYATEIGEFLIEYASNKLKLKQILATVSPDNIGSQNVLSKLGFKVHSNIYLEERGSRLLLLKKLKSYA